MIEVDCLIIGAGPAGCCAALRLLQLGYRVGLVERVVFPRPQIGESLTPGIRNILTLLDADDALAGLPHITGKPTFLRWERDVPELAAHADTALVSRAEFDERLLHLAEARGARVWQPARVLATGGQPGAWKVCIGCNATGRTGDPGMDSTEEVTAQWVFDATGRQGIAKTRMACAPSLMAVWGEWGPTQVPPGCLEAIRVEALSRAWLWAAPLPSRGLRVMLFADPRALGTNMHALWREALAESKELHVLSELTPTEPLRVCSATPYLDTEAWRPGRIKLGDAAFALDPISGSGVEKAMRFSLHASVAWHTWASAADEAAKDLARQYFIRQLNETCARHVAWCGSYYARAWSADGSFWRERSQWTLPAVSASSSYDTDESVAAAFIDALAKARVSVAIPPVGPPSPLPLPAATARVRLDPASQLTPQLCVVENRVRLAPAVSHPRLPRAVAFVANQALAPHWALLRREQSMHELYRGLGETMEPESARAVVSWLWRSGVLVLAM